MKLTSTYYVNYNKYEGLVPKFWSRLWIINRLIRLATCIIFRYSILSKAVLSDTSLIGVNILCELATVNHLHLHEKKMVRVLWKVSVQETCLLKAIR